MRTAVVCLMILGSALSSTAQFYPASNSCWFGVDDDGGPPGFDVDYQMGSAPDTLIDGVVYKTMKEYIDYNFTGTYYVRSDADGKGYAYVPDLGGEYLTGDIGVQLGDTVHDVLWKDTDQSFTTFDIIDVVVDSVVTLTNSGVTVTRHYVSNNFSSTLFPSFWQAGMGAGNGPMLDVTGFPYYCTVGDTVMFDRSNSNGLPGPIGIPICPLVVSGVGNIEPHSVHDLNALPNPSKGLFEFSDGHKHSFTVFTTQGLAILTGNSSVINLLGEPTGIYSTIVETPQGRQALRLVVQR